ncbi:MAG: AAA family ATPase [Patescibacteria group bacterium]
MTIVSLTGASGVGKSTLQSSLASHFGGGVVRSTTTRSRRAGDSEHDYEFLSEADFFALEEDFVMPPVTIHGNWYVGRISAYRKALAETDNKFAVTCLTPERHKVLRHYFEPIGISTLAIHLISPPEEELRRRLAERKWTAEELEFRIQDSRHFDEWARNEGDMHFFEPDIKENILTQALRLIETN